MTEWQGEQILKEDGAMSQGMKEASQSWKSQGNGFCPGASRNKCSPSDDLHYSPVRPISDFWSPEVWDNKSVLI